MTSKTTNRSLSEVRAWATRLVFDLEADIRPIGLPFRPAAKIGCSAHTLNAWENKAGVDAGKRAIGWHRTHLAQDRLQRRSKPLLIPRETSADGARQT